MILGGTPEDWDNVWGAIEEEMAESTEKGLTVIFSVQEVETVCAVKMLQVRQRPLPAHTTGGCAPATESSMPCEMHLGQLAAWCSHRLLLASAGALSAHSPSPPQHTTSHTAVPRPHTQTLHVLCTRVVQVALRTKGIQFSQYPVEDEASLTKTLHQLLADSTVSLRSHTHQPPPACTHDSWQLLAQCLYRLAQRMRSNS
jgi:hypothetical protein